MWMVLRPLRALSYVSETSHPHLSGSASDVPGPSVKASLGSLSDCLSTFQTYSSTTARH